MEEKIIKERIIDTLYAEIFKIKKQNEKYDFKDLCSLMTLLRSDEGCPWDRAQTHKSLKKYLIEETYEVLETIDNEDDERLCDELGDLLLQIIFHARIADEEGRFDIASITDGICRKMVSRHTHVFADAKAVTPDDVVNNWEEIKKKEKGLRTHTGVLKDVPASLPALMRSQKVQQKASKVGFDWDNTAAVWVKIEEELRELKEACSRIDSVKINEEFGDVLFSLVNLSRFLKVQPELALTGSIEKFIRRFEYIEENSKEVGRKLEDMTLDEMDVLWEEAKEKLTKDMENQGG